jgi:hypothetical protein
VPYELTSTCFFVSFFLLLIISSSTRCGLRIKILIVFTNLLPFFFFFFFLFVFLEKIIYYLIVDISPDLVFLNGKV